MKSNLVLFKMNDDTLLRQVGVLQAFLKMLELHPDSLGDSTYVEELNVYKSRLTNFIKAHANKFDLACDPLDAIEQHIVSISNFFTLAEKDYKLLVNWKEDWLESFPTVDLVDLQSARAELDEIVTSIPKIQQRLKGHLSPNDWQGSLESVDLHPEIMVCAEILSNLPIRRKAQDRAALYQFANNEGPLVAKVSSHFDAMRFRIDELIKLHGFQEKALIEAEIHLENHDFRKAEIIFRNFEINNFSDLNYELVKLKLKEFNAWLEQFQKAKKTFNGQANIENHKAVQSELQKLRELIKIPDSEFGRESLAILNQIETNLNRVRTLRRKRLIAMVIFCIIVSTLTIFYVISNRAFKEGVETALAINYEKFRGDSVGEEKVIEIASGVNMAFSWCPPGNFMMGSPPSEEGRGYDEDQVKVTISKGFWMAKTEVTQAQWNAVMGRNSSHFSGDNLPIENVSWYDAKKFIQKLNAKIGNADGGKMALPTEAQWEYAARAGESGPHSGGSLDEVAWYNINSRSQTHAVGAKKSNAWGLHDMLGNVWEWCEDWYGRDLSGVVDPKGASEGDGRVYKGGGWSNGGGNVWRFAERRSLDPSMIGTSVGFRVCRSLAPRLLHVE